VTGLASTTDAVLARIGDDVRRSYGWAVGRQVDELPTPALILDIDAAQRNIEHMAGSLERIGRAVIRPHIKVHKSPDLSHRQIDAGAVGLSVATVWEAAVMVRSGIDHVFVVNTVAGQTKLRVLAELAREADVLVAIDDLENARSLAAAARAAGTSLGVMIEVDTGMDRAGVDTADSAVALARAVIDLSGLHLEGVTGYEGHCSMTVDNDLRHVRQIAAMSLLVEVAERLEADGIPCPIRSAGGTATWDWTAAFPGITEIQAGTYVVMDNFHGRMVAGFEHSLTVLATVISTPPGRVIVDAGGKSMGAPDLATIVGHDLPVLRFDEEHGIFVDDGSGGLAVGDVVHLVPGYSPSTVNWYEAFYVVHNSVVVEIWPVVPRGPLDHGLAQP
jgi:D-serine deaminase-like pyridoxal phosphate-dependent protein